MKKREAEFGQLFRHWIKANGFQTAAFELKQTTSNSLSFSDVQEHQIAALLAVKYAALLYKIPDDSRGTKPFDMVHLQKADAYVVIRYPECFCIIDIDAFVSEEYISDRKSLTAERARVIAYKVVEL